MGQDDFPQLISTLKAKAGEDKRLSCADAFRIAREHGVSPEAVGKTCDELGIKLSDCQLGCF